MTIAGFIDIRPEANGTFVLSFRAEPFGRILAENAVSAAALKHLMFRLFRMHLVRVHGEHIRDWVFPEGQTFSERAEAWLLHALDEMECEIEAMEFGKG
jgi:hypothetical protein